MKLFNNYQKFQNIFAKDSKNFPKNFYIFFLKFLLILKRFIGNFNKNILKFLKCFLRLFY